MTMTATLIKTDCYGTPIRPNCQNCKGTGYVDSWTCVACQVAHAEEMDAKAAEDEDEFDYAYDPYFD